MACLACAASSGQQLQAEHVSFMLKERSSGPGRQLLASGLRACSPACPGAAIAKPLALATDSVSINSW